MEVDFMRNVFIYIAVVSYINCSKWLISHHEYFSYEPGQTYRADMSPVTISFGGS